MAEATERQEMLEELQRLMVKRHPLPMLLKAVEERDEEIARLVLEAAQTTERLTPKELMKANYLVDKTFTETHEAWRERQDRAREEHRAEVGAALTSRQERRRAQQQKVAGRTRPSRGVRAPLGPVEDDARYARPTEATSPSRRGAGRDTVRKAYPA